MEYYAGPRIGARDEDGLAQKISGDSVQLQEEIEGNVVLDDDVLDECLPI